jgi:fucose permease
MAFFVLFYVGVEVTIGGWIVSYIINVRGGGPSSGYVSSGFFGGLTFGRVALLWINKKVGERRVVFIWAALSIAYVSSYNPSFSYLITINSRLEFVVWFVPSLVGNAVAVSFVGVFLGPMYPLCMNHAGRVLPQKILTGSIGERNGTP